MALQSRRSPVTDKTMKWPSRCVDPAAVRSGPWFSVRPRASAWPASAHAWSGPPRTTGTSASPRKYRNIGLTHLWPPWAGEWLASMGKIISRVKISNTIESTWLVYQPIENCWDQVYWTRFLRPKQRDIVHLLDFTQRFSVIQNWVLKRNSEHLLMFVDWRIKLEKID